MEENILLAQMEANTATIKHWIFDVSDEDCKMLSLVQAKMVRYQSKYQLASIFES